MGSDFPIFFIDHHAEGTYLLDFVQCALLKKSKMILNHTSELTAIFFLLSPPGWQFGAIMCKAVPYLQGVAVCASVSTLVVIAVDR